MSAEMKWYIFNSAEDDAPLVWSDKGELGKALEFDTEAAAQVFLDSMRDLPCLDEEFYYNAYIKQCIFFYDDGKLNATGKIVVMNGDDVELREYR